METFRAEVTFFFDAPSLEATGDALRHLEEVAADAGFLLQRGSVVLAPSDDPGESEPGGTGYGPPARPRAG
jgi:hypothetical protein